MMSSLLKVLIVDDEKIIRDGMVSGVDWESLGYEVCGQAEDGEIAVERVRELHPDLIITDIKMPFIDGLQLVEIMKTDYPDILTVIISGHDEFEYARKAVKLGAYDYLLKPLDLEYLTQMLIRIKKHIRSSRERMRNSDELRQMKIFRKLWSGLSVSDEENEYLSVLWKNSPEDLVFYAAVLSVEQAYVQAPVCRDAEPQLLDFLIRELFFSKETEYEKALILLAEGKYGIVLAGDDFSSLNETAGEFFIKTTQSFQDNFGLPVFISVSGMHKGISRLSDAAEEAEKAFEFRYIAGSKSIVYFNRINKGDALNSSYYDIAPLIFSLKQADKMMLRNELNIMLKAAIDRRENARGFISFVCAGLLRSAEETVNDFGGRIEDVFSDPVNEFNRLSSITTLEKAIEQLNHVLDQIIDYINSFRKTELETRIEKAKEFIHSEYNSRGISLQQVADHVHMNLCYLSEIFRKYTGCTYIEYLTRYRIDKAADLLLNTDYRSYEIADMAGYENATYFSTTFKRVKGVSPTDFRKGRGRIEKDET